MISSRYIRVVENGKISFFFMPIHISLYIYHIFFILLSINGHRLLLYVGYCKQCCNAAINVEVHIFFQLLFLFSSGVKKVELVNHMVVVFLIF